MTKTLLLTGIVTLFGLAVAALPAIAAQPKKEVIMKCQDAQGNWHYGDEAADECARTKVIELSGQGVKTGEIKAPLTQEQLKARSREQAQEEDDKKRAQEQARRDQQLLATYGHEDDIIYIRDRKLAQIEASIAATSETVKPLRAALERMQAEAAKAVAAGKPVPDDLQAQIRNTQGQITRHEARIASQRKEEETIREQAQSDLERYRELKAEQAQNAAVQPAPSDGAKKR
jgi:hypothetical protein